MVTALIRAGGRVLTGSSYAVFGAAALSEPGARVQQAAPLLAKIRKVVPLPDDELVVRGNGAVQLIAGGLLAVGVLPRLSALAITVSVVPTTLAGHAFWEIEDPTARKLQRIQFQKNTAMIGGLLFAMAAETRAKDRSARKA